MRFARAEGHAYVSAGVECVSRYRDFGSAGVDPEESHNPQFAERSSGHNGSRPATNAGTTPGTTAIYLTSTSRWGRRLRMSPLCAVFQSRADEFGVRSQHLAEKAIANGLIDAEIAPVTLADGTVVTADDGPRPIRRWRPSPRCQPVFRSDGTVTAGTAAR